MSGNVRVPEFFSSHIEGAILLAPAVWARHTQPWYQRWLLWLAVHTVPSWRPTGEGLEIQATDNIEALREMFILSGYKNILETDIYLPLVQHEIDGQVNIKIT